MIVPREGRKKEGREGQRERRKAEAKIKNITNIIQKPGMAVTAIFCIEKGAMTLSVETD